MIITHRASSSKYRGVSRVWFTRIACREMTYQGTFDDNAHVVRIFVTLIEPDFELFTTSSSCVSRPGVYVSYWNRDSRKSLFRSSRVTVREGIFSRGGLLRAATDVAFETRLPRHQRRLADLFKEYTRIARAVRITATSNNTPPNLPVTPTFGNPLSINMFV